MAQSFYMYEKNPDLYTDETKVKKRSRILKFCTLSTVWRELAVISVDFFSMINIATFYKMDKYRSRTKLR